MLLFNTILLYLHNKIDLMKCVNNNCTADPLLSVNVVVATIDGDLACNEECKQEYEKQKQEFFDNIGNDEYYNTWMNS